MGKPERGRETKGRGGAVDAAQRRPCAEPYRPGHPSTPSPHRISAESLSPTTICFNVVPTLSQSREEKEERRPEREGVRARKRLRERKRASAVASTAREPRLTTPRPTSSNWIWYVLLVPCFHPVPCIPGRSLRSTGLRELRPCPLPLWLLYVLLFVGESLGLGLGPS